MLKGKASKHIKKIKKWLNNYKNIGLKIHKKLKKTIMDFQGTEPRFRFVRFIFDRRFRRFWFQNGSVSGSRFGSLAS